MTLHSIAITAAIRTVFAKTTVFAIVVMMSESNYFGIPKLLIMMMITAIEVVVVDSTQLAMIVSANSEAAKVITGKD